MDLQESSRVTEKIQRADRSKWFSHNNHNIKCFTEGEIGRITNNYGAILGKGSFGEVYKGVLKDGSTVAVKRFLHHVEEDFAKELKVRSEINHKNVVRLIGYCAEENARIILTEYISRGNLSDALHHDCITIVLDTRLQIAVECSEALCYMHSQMYTRVIHGDIKPTNILLDDNFSAKICDFGISRLVNTEATLFTEHVTGSIGYMDPLFARYGCLTSKSDVYSFGIVLLELITKKKATIMKGDISIVECFTQALAIGIRRVRELFDVEISSQNNMKVLEGVAKLAGECLRMEMDRRPEMIDVAERLRALRKTHVQGKQTITIFPWGWRNKPAAKYTRQSSASMWCRRFSLDEMKFDRSHSHLVRWDGHGEVYYGVIDGGATKVTIKSSIGVKEADIAKMAKLHHHHMVSLIGYCTENKEMMLLYDFMAHGTMSGKLYGHNMKEPPLTWRQRLEICIGAARALEYLHECSMIHRDFTTANILLDERLVAKVWVTRELAWETERLDEMAASGDLCSGLYYMVQEREKIDVQAFGVVLFEVLCARAAFDRSLPTKQVHLLTCALNCKKKGILDLIVDPHLEGKISPWCFNKFVETAEKCVAFESVDRPSMREVLQKLEMCLAEESGSIGDEMSGDDVTNHPSMEERRRNLEKYLSDESGRYGSELWMPDNHASSMVSGSPTAP